jgi:hypothetical protein
MVSQEQLAERASIQRSYFGGLGTWFPKSFGFAHEIHANMNAIQDVNRTAFCAVNRALAGIFN